MAISAAQVKQLRERTGAGMMECKRALEAAGGDVDAAADTMRREGLAKADKKAGRIAAEGRIAAAVADGGRRALLLEVNCETDFVAKNDAFGVFVDKVAAAALAAADRDGLADLDALAELDLGGETVEQRRRAVIATLGENVTLRRFEVIGGDTVAAYSHGTRIGSVVALAGGDADLARDVAMHVAATAPRFGTVDDVPAEVRENERAFLKEQAQGSGKPEEIIDKMVEGRLKKFLAELTLTGQPFVKDPDQTVEKLLGAQGARLQGFGRFEVGEGIEKVKEDFAAEVEAQVECQARGKS